MLYYTTLHSNILYSIITTLYETKANQRAQPEPSTPHGLAQGLPGDHAVALIYTAKSLLVFLPWALGPRVYGLGFPGLGLQGLGLTFDGLGFTGLRLWGLGLTCGLDSRV